MEAPTTLWYTTAKEFLLACGGGGRERERWLLLHVVDMVHFTKECRSTNMLSSSCSSFFCPIVFYCCTSSVLLHQVGAEEIHKVFIELEQIST